MVNKLAIESTQHPKEKSSEEELRLLFQKKKQTVDMVKQRFMTKATVLKVDRDSGRYELVFTDQSRPFRAVLARSCLQLAQVGDVVSVQGFDDDTVYILAVLESASRPDEETIFELPDNALIKGVGVRVEAKSYQVKSAQYKLNSTMYVMTAGSIKQVSQSFEVVADNAVSSFVNSRRYVSNTDRVKALNINYSAEAVSKLSGKITMLNGQEILKSDGKLMIVG